jgi:hypothetical protein
MGPTRPQYGAPTATRPYLPMVYANGPQVGSNMPTADAYGLGAAGINMPPDLNYAMNTPLIMRQRLLGNVPPNAAQQQAQGAGSEVYGVPRGVDARWWQQFAQEHPYRTKDGRTVYLTPDQVYERDGEYAVAHALHDKAWGDQFYRTYGRPPTEDDWKASYYDRQRSFYGG